MVVHQTGASTPDGVLVKGGCIRERYARSEVVILRRVIALLAAIRFSTENIGDERKGGVAADSIRGIRKTLAEVVVEGRV